MFTFLAGILILVLGYVFYSRYVERQFAPDNRKTPADEDYDGVDFVPLSTGKNMLIHLLNIAGLGPILGAIQGILFGPVAFLLIPLGCIFMGGVHDYFSAMISMRNDGAQISEIIHKYLGENFFRFFLVIVAIMLLLLATVFVFTSGDIIAQRFFSQNDFSLTNPVMLFIYGIIALYYILATLFPIDKIIGRFYPFFTTMLILGSLLVVVGFFVNGVNLQEFNIHQINLHPNKTPLLPIFFMTVSCGLLSGFHATQATIISRTVKNEFEGRKIFYGMMCAESLIAMIWAAAAMHVYSLHIVPDALVGQANVINTIADTFVHPMLAFIVTIAVVILPITSGDTALRALRMTIADAIKLKQNAISNRLKIIIPIAIALLGILYWAKSNSGSFTLIWRYFTFVNQLIAIPTFLFATIFLFQNKKNYIITLLPGLFYIYITMSFIFNAQIGFNLSYEVSQILGVAMTLLGLIFVIKKMKTKNNE